MDSALKRVQIFGYLDLFLTVIYAGELFIPQIWNVVSQDKYSDQTVFSWIINLFLGLTFLVLALLAITLIQVMNPNISNEERYKHAKFWVYINIIGLFLLLALSVILFIDWRNNLCPFPAPLIIYILFKLISLIYVKYVATVNWQPLRYVPERRLGGSRAPQVHSYGNRRLGHLDSVLNLKPYRGNGVSLVNCQCVAPQVRD